MALWPFDFTLIQAVEEATPSLKRDFIPGVVATLVTQVGRFWAQIILNCPVIVKGLFMPSSCHLPGEVDSEFVWSEDWRCWKKKRVSWLPEKNSKYEVWSTRKVLRRYSEIHAIWLVLQALPSVSSSLPMQILGERDSEHVDTQKIYQNTANHKTPFLNSGLVTCTAFGFCLHRRACQHQWCHRHRRGYPLYISSNLLVRWLDENSSMFHN